MRINGLVFRLAVPTFVVGFTGQVASLVARIAVSYQAVAIGMSPSAVLVLSSSFALLPIFLAVWLGRYTDRKGAGPVVLCGSALMLLGAILPLAVSASVAALAIAMAAMGVGQTLQIAALQSEISQVQRPRQRDRMIGSFMVYQSLGQIAAPALLSLVDAQLGGVLHTNLLVVAALICLVQLGASLPILQSARRPTPSDVAMPLAAIIRTPGLAWLAVAGSLCVAAQDVLYVYTPVMASEREIAPTGVGIALGAFAVTQMLARVVYARLAQIFRRIVLMIVGLLATCACLAGVSFAGGVVSLTLCLGATGLALGLGVTSAVSLTMQNAPVSAKATTLSLRLAVNRAAQFAVPLMGGAVAPWLGTGAVFLALGAMIGGSLLAVPRSLQGQRKSDHRSKHKL